MVLRDVKVNQFPAARRTALFVEPTPSGYARVNLAELTRHRIPRARRPFARRYRPRRNPARLSPPSRSAATAAAKPSRRAGASRYPRVPCSCRSSTRVVGAPMPTAPGDYERSTFLADVSRGNSHRAMSRFPLRLSSTRRSRLGVRSALTFVPFGVGRSHRSRFRAFERIGPTEVSGMPSRLPISR